MLKPSLLFISPIPPAMGGNGLAMRAGALLESLVELADVHLLVVPIADPGCRRLVSPLAAQCKAACLVPIPRITRLLGRVGTFAITVGSGAGQRLPFECSLAGSALLRSSFHCFSAVSFDRIFVFRTYMSPFARPYIEANPGARSHLDLDDIDSLTRQSLALLLRGNGGTLMSRRLSGEAAYYTAYEREFLPMYNSVSVCSEKDRDRLCSELRPDRVKVLPNTVREPRGYPLPRSLSQFKLLFVGNLGYYPNQDAIRFFISRILPGIRSNSPTPIRFIVVGSGNAAWTSDLPASDCSIIGAVEDLAEYYQAAHAVVVPLRAGGGTRTKILEAFGYRRPVVTTSLGAEGLQVQHESEVLLADTPEEFAKQCLRLISDRELTAALTARAERLLRNRYLQTALTPILDAMLKSP